MNILVVDDEVEIADLVKVYLDNDGHRVFLCHTGQEALQVIETQGAKLHLALLDIMLPDIDGFHICKKIRENYTFPVIMLTAKSEDIDKINGLSLGADDYITKPFSPLVVQAKVRAQLRRYTRYNQGFDSEEKQQREGIFEYEGLIVNKKTHQCILYDREIPLTPIEFDILWTLCENQGNVVSAEALFETVWGEQYLDCNNTVMVHIRRLRAKLHEPPRNPRFIKTVWGVGYRIETDNNR